MAIQQSLFSFLLGAGGDWMSKKVKCVEYLSTYKDHVFFNLIFFLTDIEAPVITSPNNIRSRNVDPGMPDAAITWSPLPSALDAFEGVIGPDTIVCMDDVGNVVMSGGRFPVGTTTVTCRANDTSLNEGSSQFTIMVIGRY